MLFPCFGRGMYQPMTSSRRADAQVTLKLNCNAAVGTKFSSTVLVDRNWRGKLVFFFFFFVVMMLVTCYDALHVAIKSDYKYV